MSWLFVWDVDFTYTLALKNKPFRFKYYGYKAIYIFYKTFDVVYIN